MNIEALSVTEVINQIKQSLEGEFRSVVLTGEISNLSYSAAGHYYFNVSDENSSLSCAMFKMDALRNPLIRRLKDGDQIIVSGPISVYAKKGTFQLLAKRVLPAGKGNLQAQFEYLKAKLTEEGLFDLAHKKPLPLFPKRIAVITALGGAALQDFLNVMKRRCLWLDVIVIPAIVQGEASASSLLSALNKAQAYPEIDVIVLTRGGGAIEDLWSFNDEKLVRAIAACPIAVMSAVGHHVDYTLCDYVADFRAETPTAAAEILSQAQTELKQRMHLVGHKLKHRVYDFHTQLERKVKKLNPLNLVYLMNQKLHQFQLRLNQAELAKRVHELIPLNEYQRQADDLLSQMDNLMQKKIQLYQHRLGLNFSMLNGLNPNNVLTRGYSILWSKHGLVTDAKTFERLDNQEKLQLQFHDGKVNVKKD